MKQIILFSLISLFSVSLIAQDIEKEKEAIKKAIQTGYVEGLQNEGNAEKIDIGIHPDFKLLGVDKGDQMWKLPIKEWKEKQVKKKESGELPRKVEEEVSIKFLFIDITGNAAVAKFEFYVGKELKYIDYISLYKFESGWKMVSKIYSKV